jgi:hypothetical protein
VRAAPLDAEASYQGAVKCRVAANFCDDFQSLYECVKVIEGLLPALDFCVARKSWRQKSLVNKWIKAHYRGDIYNTNYELLANFWVTPNHLCLSLYCQKAAVVVYRDLSSFGGQQATLNNHPNNVLDPESDPSFPWQTGPCKKYE